MSVWSILLACQGFRYDGPAGEIGFEPVWKPEDHASFFTGAEGWGLFRQTRRGDRQQETLDLRWGRLRLSKLVFAVPQAAKSVEVSVTLGETTLPATYSLAEGRVTISLGRETVLEAGQSLHVEIAALD